MLAGSARCDAFGVAGEDRVDERSSARRSGTATLSPEAERRFNQLGETVNHIDEVLWVYQHLDDEQVGPRGRTQPRGVVDALSCPNAEGRSTEKVYWPLIRDISRAPESHSRSPQGFGQRAAGY